MFAEGRPCIIINQFYSLALSVLDEPDNPPIIGLKPDGSDKQKWIPTQEEDGTWTLKNVANGKFLSVEGDPTAGASVIGADSPTLWTIDIDGSGSGSSWILTEDSELSLNFLRRTPPGFPNPVILDGTRLSWRFVGA